MQVWVGHWQRVLRISIAACTFVFWGVQTAFAQPVIGDLRLSRESDRTTSLTGYFCVAPEVVGADAVPSLRLIGDDFAVAVTQMLELSEADRQSYRVIGQECGSADRIFLVSQIVQASGDAVSGGEIAGIDGNTYPLGLRRNESRGGQKFGIVYSLDHCLVSDTDYNVAPQRKIFDTSKILRQPEAEREWGPIRWNHWVGEPVEGYYCLTENPDLARKHAFLLSVMGIDFVILDMTNMGLAATSKEPDTFRPEFMSKIFRPVDSMLAEWGALTQAAQPADVPAIVPWAGVFLKQGKTDIGPGQSIGRYLVQDFLPQLKRAGLGLFMSGTDKPLLLLKMNYSRRFNPNVVAKVAQALDLNRFFTTRTMWADRRKLESRFGKKQKRHAGLSRPNNFWSFLEPCKMDGNGIRAGCGQSAGSPEQISVSVAYPSGRFMSLETKTHRRRGRTLYQQFQKVFSDRGRTKYVVFSIWNPWTNPRQCPTIGGNTPHGKGRKPVWNRFDTHAARRCEGEKWFYPGGVPAFLDNYDLERSKLIEPDRVWGDCYMSLARELVFAAKEGRDDLTDEDKARFMACSPEGFDLRP